MNPQELFDALCLPFPTAYIKWRVGNKNGDGVLPLCYVDARAVMDRLDGVCGIDGWQRTYTTSQQGLLICNIGLRMPNREWVWKGDGAGATDFEGEKGMASDAFKRAAVSFGVGRYLYDLKIKRMPSLDEKELNAIHDKKIEEWGWDVGYRPGAYVWRILGKTVDEFVTNPATAQDFREKNAGLIAQLPVRMRQRLNEKLDSAGAAQTEAA